jgi:4-aminobutyrate aminotransferase-like enzyme/Ser/Thr protein kinase RdoA (MazF antagonist)
MAHHLRVGDGPRIKTMVAPAVRQWSRDIRLAFARVAPEEAERIARELCGLDGAATPLPGEHDRNFRLVLADGSSRVVKVHPPDADPAELDLQDAALAHLGGAGTPRLEARAEVDGRPVRVLSWLEGRPWADAPADPAGLGRLVARTDRALAGLSHPAMHRPHRWNLLAAPEAAPAVELLDERRRALVEPVFARFAQIEPALAALPRQLIHNDANEHNVLVGDDGAAVGLIDFGDLVHAPRACGLGVALAYAMLGHDDPVRAVAPVVRGYHEEWPLRPEELALLYDLARTRLAMSVCIAARQYAAAPENEYLLISQAAVEAVLERLAGESAELAHFRFRDACGYEAVPHARAVRRWLLRHRAASVLDVDVATEPAVILDFHDGMDEVPEGLTIGRYGEERTIYKGPQFQGAGGRARTVHIATDLFLPAGATVRSPFAGVIEDVANRDMPYDYGGVVVVRHEGFWTLHGHLDPESIAHWRPGGGGMGTEAINGGWTPHVHLQLFTALPGRATDLPGVAYPDEADLWKSISPDPNLLLGRPDGDRARTPRDDLRERRATVMSRALSLAYREPLHIVGGEGAHLIDADGGRWLDLVNNVAHVGHGHSRVVAAGQRQMAALNTNTRYLHASVVEYARRLAATFPDPLSVCFFTNSGSEANDLALRLVKAHSGREDVLVLDHAYHGNLSSLIALSPYKFDRAGGRGRPATTRVAVPGDADSVRAQADGIAAFFAEPLQGCGGQVVFPPGYLEAAFAHVRAAGGLCVVDEVQTGFGRVGDAFWGFELQGVVPDVVTLGKPIGNGHPLGAVVTTPEVAASFVTGMEYFNTFGGNAVSAEIGLAVLDVLEDERLQEHARERGEQILAGLRGLDLVDARGHGLFLGAELRDAEEAARVKEALKARGILISTDGPLDNVLKIKPPLAIAAEDCDRFLTALAECL